MNIQIYRNIANPYMPQGSSDLTNAPSPYYAPGELGCTFVDPITGRRCLRVQLDSGATSANTVGVVAKGQLAFWKDQNAALVTNDKNQCDVGPAGAINRVAGVFQLAVSTAPGVLDSEGKPLLYMTDLVIGGLSTPMLLGAALAGAQITADTTASTARGTYTTGVNTAPVSQILGVCASATAITGSLYPVDVAIGFAE